jgi:putative Mn2+ efflux pump MntP
MNLTHLEASLLFAVACSIVLGIITKRTHDDRILYAVYCFGCFLFALFGLGWLMYFGHR